MVRIALVFAFLAGLIVSAIPAAAQDATPPSGASGEPVTIFNSNVQPIGEIAITDIVDPFEDYDLANSEPTRGYHWVKISVSLTAADQPISSGSFQLVDDSGFVTYQGYVTRSSESTTAEPDFYASDLQPGTEATGAIFFEIYNEAVPEIVEYVPTSGQTIIAADLRESGVAQGDVVSYASSTGAPIADVSVLGVIDPLDDFDSSSAPQRGFRYVGVAVSITNTSSNPFYADSSRFSVNDREGFNYFSFGVYRTPEGEAGFPTLQYGDIAPGATVAGIVSFELINGATVAEVLFTPNSDRRFRVAEFGPDDVMTPPDMAAVPTPTPAPTVDPACAEVLTWSDALDAALEPVSPVFDLVDQVDQDQTVDSQALRDGADQVRGLSADVGSLDTPEIAQAASDQLVSTLDQVADQIDALADAVDGGDATTIQTAIDSIYTTLFSIAGGAYAELGARCPEFME